MQYLELTYQSPADPFAADGRLGVPYTMNPHETYQHKYALSILDNLEANPMVTNLTLTQVWDRLPTESTVFWRVLDREVNVRFERKYVMPWVTELHIQELHPKFLCAFLRAFELPRLTKLDLDYDTDLADSRPDRSELLRMLVTDAQPVLAQLSTFRLSYELHCHDAATLVDLYGALKNVTYFSLHYWPAEFECEEWWKVLKWNWEVVAAYQANGYPMHPLLPNLQRLHVSGFTVPVLREVLALRARIGFPVWEVEYQLGEILQSEHDALKRELRVFECYQEITPDPLPGLGQVAFAPTVRSTHTL